MFNREQMDFRAKEDALKIVTGLLAEQTNPKFINKMSVNCHDPVKQTEEELPIYFIQTPITGFYPEKSLEILRRAFNVSCGAFAEHLRAFLIRTAVGDPWKIISSAWQESKDSATTIGQLNGEKISLSARTPEDLRRILVHIKIQLEQELKQKKFA